MSGATLTKRLREEFLIYTYGNSPGPNDGVYISPNVFNSAADMRAFVSAIESFAGSGS